MSNDAELVVTLDGFAVTVRPAGAPLTARFTGPLKPFTRVTATFAVFAVPWGTVTEAGVTSNEKPGAVELNVAVIELPAPAALGANVQVGRFPVQRPDQPANT